ncbi:FecR domain-containing protein, partial [Chloroflexota bacterium]
MRNKLSIILDDCLERVEKGESIEACLTEYPDTREKLEPLLKTALSISLIPKVQPSPEFVTQSRIQLINHINQVNARAEAKKRGQREIMFSWIPSAFYGVWHSFIKARQVAIPVTVIFLLMLSAGLYQLGGFSFLSPNPVMASPATLSILSGSVEIHNLESATSQEGYDGMSLRVGTGIITGSDSHALITFFEGSTTKLEPNTYLEIKQLEDGNEQATTIILKQWLGRTWNRVIKMTDSGSRYEIETPTATAIVRGTLFTTDVNGTGFTTVSTTEGLVSVAAQGKEVFVPEDQQTEIEKGIGLSQPGAIPAPTSQIIITADTTAFGSVIDPTGSSTGIFPTGEQFNQIQGSYSSLRSEDTRIITIPEPMTGEYIIALRSSAEGTRNFRIQGISEGKPVFSYTGNWKAKKESGQLIHLNLQMDDGLIVDDEISLVEPLGDKKPEKVVDRKSDDKEKSSDEKEAEDSDDEEILGIKGGPDVKKAEDDIDSPGKGEPDVKKAEDDIDSPGKGEPDVKKAEDDIDSPGKGEPDVKKAEDDIDSPGKGE